MLRYKLYIRSGILLRKDDEMPVIGNKIKKRPSKASADIVSGFTMGNEFNGLSEASILCGTEFQEYPPFQDSPEDPAEELAGSMMDISGNILGGMAAFASVLGSNKNFIQALCMMGVTVTKAVASVYDIKNLRKVIAGGAVFAGLDMETVKSRMKGFIPQNIPNETVLGTLEGAARLETWMKQPFFLFPESFPIPILRPTTIMTAAAIERHKEHNLDILLNGSPQDDGTRKPIYQSGEYIENQFYWGDVKFGISDMSYSGCEIMATYNALKALGEPVSEQTVVDLIAMYEADGAVFGGKFGTSPYAVEDYFREQGYDVMATASQDPAEINKIGENCDTVIVNAYNNKNDITDMIHTVSITKDEEGTYSVHNSFYKDENNIYLVNKGYGTLQEAIDAISDDGPSSIDVIGISNARIGDFIEPEDRVGGDLA